jgi:hypothetical protein
MESSKQEPFDVLWFPNEWLTFYLYGWPMAIGQDLNIEEPFTHLTTIRSKETVPPDNSNEAIRIAAEIGGSKVLRRQQRAKLPLPNTVNHGDDIDEGDEEAEGENVTDRTVPNMKSSVNVNFVKSEKRDRLQLLSTSIDSLREIVVMNQALGIDVTDDHAHLIRLLREKSQLAESMSRAI